MHAFTLNKKSTYGLISGKMVISYNKDSKPAFK